MKTLELTLIYLQLMIFGLKEELLQEDNILEWNVTTAKRWAKEFFIVFSNSTQIQVE